MGHCAVPQCNHQNKTHSCKLFTFPTDSPLKRKWMNLIRRAKSSPRKLHLASPHRNSRVCSCHFKDGMRSSLPTIFAWNADKRLSYSSPEKKRRQKSFVRRSLSFEEKEMTAHGLHEQDSRVEKITGVGGPDTDSETVALMQTPPNEDNQSVADLLSNASSAEPHSLNALAVQTTDLCASEVVIDSRKDVSTMTEVGKSYENLLHENLALQKKIKDLEEKLEKSTTVLHVAENTLLRSEVDRLREELQKNGEVFRFRTIEDKDLLVAHFTGLPNRQTYWALLRLFNDIDIQYVKNWKVARLSRQEQLFLTLVKLRRGLSDLDLQTRFKVEKTTVANVFLTWLLVLHHVLVKNLLLNIPSRAKNKRHLPECFLPFPNTRIILDATEFTSANPKLLSKQTKMYSSYKHRITVKGLVGIAPDGTLTFASELFAGSTSDRNTVIASGILSKLVPGDSVMADKGFNIEDLLPDGVSLNIPPFKDAPQFTPEQVDETFEIATARIHVERAINRIKCFRILDFIPESVAPYGSEIFQVCAALTNFQRPLIKHVEEGV